MSRIRGMLVLACGAIVCGVVHESAAQKPDSFVQSAPSIAKFGEKNLRPCLSSDVAEIAADTSASTPLSDRWQAGVHYTVLAPAQRTEVAPGKVELREFFQYTSPTSRALQPHLQEWLKSKPDTVEYVRQPRVLLPHMFLQARMYYALKELGREDLHLPFFDWTFEPDHYRVYHGDYFHPDEKGYFDLNLAFATANKIDRDAFTTAYHAPQRDKDLTRTDYQGRDRHIYGTSTLVINGKYSTSLQRLPNLESGMADKDFQRLLKLVDYLISLELRKTAASDSLATTK